MHILEKIQVDFMHLTGLTELQRSKNLFRKLVQLDTHWKELLFSFMCTGQDYYLKNSINNKNAGGICVR